MKVGTLFVAEVTQSIIIEWSPTAGPHPERDRGASRSLVSPARGRAL
jgi:hypothetical protein